MGNSTFVAVALFALFLVYITARGRLPNYLSVLFGKVTSDQAPNSVVTAPGGTPGTSATGTVTPLNFGDWTPSRVGASGWEIPFTGGL